MPTACSHTWIQTWGMFFHRRAGWLSSPLSDIFACAEAHMYRGVFRLVSVSASGLPVAPHWAGETDSERKRCSMSWKSCHKRSTNMIRASCPERWMVKKQAFLFFLVDLVLKLWGRQTNQLKWGESRRRSALSDLLTSLLALKARQNENRSGERDAPALLLPLSAQFYRAGWHHQRLITL